MVVDLNVQAMVCSDSSRFGTRQANDDGGWYTDRRTSRGQQLLRGLPLTVRDQWKPLNRSRGPMPSGLSGPAENKKYRPGVHIVSRSLPESPIDRPFESGALEIVVKG